MVSLVMVSPSHYYYYYIKRRAINLKIWEYDIGHLKLSSIADYRKTPLRYYIN